MNKTYLNKISTKREWQSNTIRAAWLSIVGGIAAIVALFGFDLTESTENIVELLTAFTMVVGGYFARRGRIKATKIIEK